MAVITYREALRAAMREELQRDENVVVMGEEVAQFNGAYKVTEGLLKEFGPKRVVDTPISEAGFIGLGIGASMLGIRPVMELMFWSFSYVAFDQIVNNAGNNAFGRLLGGYSIERQKRKRVNSLTNLSFSSASWETLECIKS
jgi:pyruvate dehydrogenase E1 component beta subunit